MRVCLEGTVGLAFVVNSDGSAGDIKIMQALGLGLDEAAIDAVRQWRFQPGLKEGQPVPVIATAQVNFGVKACGAGWRLTRAVFTVPEGGSRPKLIQLRNVGSVPPDVSAFNLLFDVGPDGRPVNLRLSKPSGAAWELGVIEAAGNWEFTPGRSSDSPIAVPAQFDFTRFESATKHSVISNCVSIGNVFSWSHETTPDIRHHLCIGFAARDSAV